MDRTTQGKTEQQEPSALACSEKGKPPLGRKFRPFKPQGGAYLVTKNTDGSSTPSGLTCRQPEFQMIISPDCVTDSYEGCPFRPGLHLHFFEHSLADGIHLPFPFQISSTNPDRTSDDRIPNQQQALRGRPTLSGLLRFKTLFSFFPNLSNPGKHPTRAAQSDISKKLKRSLRRKEQSLSIEVFQKESIFVIQTISSDCATDY